MSSFSNLELACNLCDQSMGQFYPNITQYICTKCGNKYLHVNGILDCLKASSNFTDVDLHRDQLSSFAQLNGADFTSLSARLNDLFIGTAAANSAKTRRISFLDVGCGFGDVLVSTSSRFDFVVGVNSNFQELEHAAKALNHFQINNSLLIYASAQKLPFMPGQFQAISCIQVLEHVRNPIRALRELRQALAEGGLLFLSIPNRYTLRCEPHTRMHGIGFLPRPAALWYATQCGRDKEFRSVHMLSRATIERWMKRVFPNSFQFIRSGYHQNTLLGRLAQSVWDLPILGLIAGYLIADIEVLAMHQQHSTIT